ncbi:MAG: DUF3667 domain-containing protein [Woeseiaceae bacterium]|nr:DUF3667 domain-containing protein [Woeseiaceae bacterium]
MNQTSGPVYEVTFDIDGEFVEQFDIWLNSYLNEIRHSPNIREADVFECETVGVPGSRVLRIRFAGDPELQDFATSPTAPDQQLPASQFAEGVTASVRVLRHSNSSLQPPAETCLNCGSTLAGQYCGNCGQRAASRLISLIELLKDAFGELLEFDSRLWRTLVTLSIRPGKLTRDYLRGRRVRYMPPFRMYLVLSIVFFLIAFFDPQEEFGILFEAQAPADVAGDVDPTSQSADAAIDPDSVENDDGTQAARVTVGDDFEAQCDMDGLGDDDIPSWLASRLTAERLKVMCNRIVADDGRAFVNKLLDNVPVALFILLPVMAFVLQVLYPLSRRYYVEHLLFVVHYHSFVFLILSVQALFSRLGGLAIVPDWPFDILGLALALYVPVYLLLAQRRVYEQGRVVTFLKFSLLAFAYFVGLLIMFAMVAIFAAFSI